MSSVSTFGSFTTARLGIYAAQKGLSVTGNNIANINTIGYSRQVLDQVSFRAGSSDRYQFQYDARVGNGVLCTGVSQIRDPYLDIRYRNEVSSLGQANGKLAGLNELASILDEVFKGGEEKNGIIEAQFMDFLNKLQNLSVNTGQEGYDSQVRASASALATLFRTYASRLEEVNDNTVEQLKQDITTVNGILKNIGELNASIRKSEIHGDSALEMRDQRNQLIDQLSEYMKVDVIYSAEDVGGGQTVEKLTIKLGNANSDPNVTSDSATLVDGAYAAQIGLTQVPKENPNYDPNSLNPPDRNKYLLPDGTTTNDAALAARVDSPNYDITLSELRDSRGKLLAGSAPVNLDDNDLRGALQATRELLTESGEFASTDYINTVDENAASKRGIPYYRKSLDLLANQFAAVFNEANQGYQMNQDGFYVDAQGQVLQPVGGRPLNKNDQLNDAEKQFLKDHGVAMGGNLFSNRGDSDDATGITAANISVSAAWSKGDMSIVSSFIRPTEMNSGTTDATNVIHMISLMGTKVDFMPGSVVPGLKNPALFHGTFQEMLGNISSELGSDQRSTNIELNNYASSAVELDSSRDAVAGVDLNDEATNLMQYQKSYSAACRLMTTLDEVLDKLINNTGIVGR